MRVCKFGGSSLTHSRGFRNAAEVMASDQRRRVAVLSAPGRRRRGDEKITDVLLGIGEKAEEGRNSFVEREVLTDRFSSIESELIGSTTISDRLVSSIDSRLDLSIDALVSMGEEFSCLIMAEFMRREGINADIFDPELHLPVELNEDGIFVSNPDNPRTRLALRSLLDSNEVVCAPGFYGVDEQGNRRLFPRGGSDYTAAVLSAAIGAELCEKFTDVDGIMVDTSSEVIIPSLTYQELFTLTKECGVFQHEAVEPLMMKNIPMRITSSFNPMAEGTTVYPEFGEVA
jgi:aspartate kinase